MNDQDRLALLKSLRLKSIGIGLLLVVCFGEAVAIVKISTARRAQPHAPIKAAPTSDPTMYYINELPISGTDERQHVYVVTSGRDVGDPGSWMVSKFAHKSLNSAELASFIARLPRNTYIEMEKGGASQHDLDALRNRCAKAGVHFAVEMRCLWPRTLENLERTR